MERECGGCGGIAGALLECDLAAGADPCACDERHRRAVEAAGGRYEGMQEGGAFGRFVCFTEPETGSTTWIPPEQATVAGIRAKLREIRAAWGLDDLRASEPPAA
jgi:hypothetical protein